LLLLRYLLLAVGGRELGLQWSCVSRSLAGEKWLLLSILRLLLLLAILRLLLLLLAILGLLLLLAKLLLAGERGLSGPGRVCAAEKGV
jgi:hypothetical protein